MRTPLEKYLRYYESTCEPGYAVLVTGAWGIGKTHQVKAALKEEETFYVSLFGRESVSAIKAAIFTEMYPNRAGLSKLSTEAKKRFSDLFGLTGKILGSGSELLTEWLSRQVKTSGVIVLDDLERCKVPIDDLLGVINQYVEHQKCKVVVIAHDEEISGDLNKRKEKLFGQVIKATPQIELAYEAFKASLCESARTFACQHDSVILGTYKETGCESLRILRHIVEDVGRLYSVLSKEYRANQKAMAELLGIFVALNAYTRSGELNGPALRGRKHAHLTAAAAAISKNRNSENGDLQKPTIIELNERHPAIDLASYLITDDALTEMLVHGVYSQTLIAEGLDASHYFTKPDNAPAWKLVSGFDTYENEVVVKALKQMEEQFESREETNSGDMLHIFAMRFMMVANGLRTEVTIDTVKEECTSYIDDLRNDDRLPARDLSWRWQDDFSNGHTGYGYWIEDSYRAAFNEVFQHLVHSRELVLEGRFSRIVSELYELMSSNSEEFMARTCSCRYDTDQCYAQIPIFKKADPKDFVDAWMRSPKANWRNIKYALEIRYSAHALRNELRSEREWIESVAEKLQEEALKQEGFARLRIKRVIPEEALQNLQHSSANEKLEN